MIFERLVLPQIILDLIGEKVGLKIEDEDTLCWAIKKLLYLHGNQKKSVEYLTKKMNQRWIPVTERLPDCEKEVLIVTEKGTITVAMYEDGTLEEEDSVYNWNDIDFDYDEETDTSYIPEGWWEYKHYHPDDVYNYEVDETVVAWMPLPEPYKPE